MSSSKCLNCETVFHDQERFCPRCGQKADTHRLTLAHFIHEFFHAFTHADKGIFNLIKGLLLHPGKVAREYVQGKRKRYFNPFTFFLIMMGFFVLSNKLVVVKTPNAIPAGVYKIADQQQREKTIGIITRGNHVRSFTQKNGNIMAMFAIPIIALIYWLFYRRRYYNYAEHLTANLLFTTIANVFFTLIVFPLQRLTQGSPYTFAFTFLGLLLQIAYFTFAYTGFLEVKSTGGIFKALGIAFLSIIIWTLVSMTGMAIYIYQSWDFYQFFIRLAGGGR